jgi:hypothetical protein
MENEGMLANKGLTRRGFLVGSGAMIAAGTMAACTTSGGDSTTEVEKVVEPWVLTHNPPESWDKECDVLIVGGGVGGCLASIEADELGVSTILMEASDDLYGNTALSGGAFAGAGSVQQQQAGLNDDGETFYVDWLKAGSEMGDPDIIRAVTYLSGDTINRLLDLGCPLALNTDVEQNLLSGHTIPRIHWSLPAGTGEGVMAALKEYVQGTGVELLYNTTVTQLYRAESGQVVGVLAAAADGTTMNVKAKKGVILACAGPGADFNRLEKYMPVFKELRKKTEVFCSSSYPTDTGNMLDEAVAINAGWNNIMPYYSCGSTTNGEYLPGGEPVGIMAFGPLFATDGIIEVSSLGKRFNNEESSYEMLTDCYWRDLPGMCFAIILDSEILKGPLTQIYFKGGRGFDVDEAFDKGFESIGKADTLDELATQLKIDAAGLKKTVETWNNYVTAGSDPEFGRQVFGPGIHQPPFYGVWVYCSFAMCKGGLKVNTDCQVTDIYSKPIPGLYAAGDIASGQVQGSARVHIGGGGCGLSANMGRIAGKAAAAAPSWE